MGRVDMLQSDRILAMKILAAIGLLFSAYCFLQVVNRWKSRTAIEKTIWFIVIAVGGGWCVSVLMR